MDYIVSGLTLMDILAFPDGSRSKPQIGGTPLYAYAGIRPFTKSILFSARVGRDVKAFYGKWFQDNGVELSGLHYLSEHTPASVLHFDEKENYQVHSFFTDDNRDIMEWRPKISDFDGQWDGVKGFYLASGPPPGDEIWEGLLKARQQHGFCLMWEPTVLYTEARFCREIMGLTRHLDMVSFNLTEGMRIFGADSEEALLDILCGLSCKIVLLRLGDRGMYVIHNGEAWLVPPLTEKGKVVDVTGCGNAATAAALYGWCETKNPVLTGIMASVAAHYNLLQKGPYPAFTDEVMAEAGAFVREMYQKKVVQKKYNKEGRMV